jgi:hypothetical protein
MHTSKDVAGVGVGAGRGEAVHDQVQVALQHLKRLVVCRLDLRQGGGALGAMLRDDNHLLPRVQARRHGMVSPTCASQR